MMITLILLENFLIKSTILYGIYISKLARAIISNHFKNTGSLFSSYRLFSSKESPMRNAIVVTKFWNLLSFDRQKNVSCTKQQS